MRAKVLVVLTCQLKCEGLEWRNKISYRVRPVGRRKSGILLTERWCGQLRCCHILVIFKCDVVESVERRKMVNCPQLPL